MPADAVKSPSDNSVPVPGISTRVEFNFPISKEGADFYQQVMTDAFKNPATALQYLPAVTLYDGSQQSKQTGQSDETARGLATSQNGDSDAAKPEVKTVKKRDTLWAYSEAFLESETGRKPTDAEIQKEVNIIAEQNHIQNPDRIYEGQQIEMPQRHAQQSDSANPEGASVGQHGAETSSDAGNTSAAQPPVDQSAPATPADPATPTTDGAPSADATNPPADSAPVAQNADAGGGGW